MEVIIDIVSKICTRCTKDKPLSDFHKHKEGSLGKNRLSVDHCHTTGKVRGLLCDNCNKSLGLLKDSIEIVSNMLIYLQNGKK